MSGGLEACDNLSINGFHVFLFDYRQSLKLPHERELLRSEHFNTLSGAIDFLRGFVPDITVRCSIMQEGSDPFIDAFLVGEAIEDLMNLLPPTIPISNFDYEATETAFTTLLQAFNLQGDDIHLIDTPKRAARAWRDEWMCGYSQDPEEILEKAVFPNSDGYDEMIVVKDIEVYSTCAHHLAPFFGLAHVGYLPRDKIIGVSKIIRLVNCFARRLQVQERLTCQIANALEAGLAPLGCGVVIEAQHLCLRSRGVRDPNSKMTTSALLGVFRNDATRDEFLRFAGK